MTKTLAFTDLANVEKKRNKSGFAMCKLGLNKGGIRKFVVFC